MANPVNMFISYSHKDEAFVDDLKKHLITLKHRKLINEWYDRELIVGDKLDDEIKSELISADFVVFIVSADFLASWYCYEVELKETLSRQEHSDVRIIPIIVGHCKWKNTELQPYLAAPKDGMPVCDHTNQDKAWVEIVDAIECAVDKYNSLKIEETVDNESSSNNCSILNDKFIEQLNDTEVVFHHKHKEKVTLNDIFVAPDLKNIKSEYDNIGKTIRALKLVDSIAPKKLILGSEQSGKTSLSKILFNTYLKQDFFPLLCNGKQIHDTDKDKLFSRLIKEQYSEQSLDNFKKTKKQRVLIIDDYNKLKINIRYQKTLLKNLAESVDVLIIISDTSIKYDESKFVELSDFMQHEILSFGNLRRNELIEKWYSIGRIETINIKELHDESDKITTHVNSIIRKNILPPKPIYVLTVIQLLETSKPSDYSLTSYGHCYQSLIQTNLEKVKIKPREFDLYINYLTELAYYLFDLGVEKINESKLEEFQKSYSEHYLLDSHQQVISELLSSGILKENNEFIGFGYRYIYYFYVAKYLADHLDADCCTNSIEHLCKNIHTERNANILIFLVHHSKDEQIIDEILLHSSVVFDAYPEATLDRNDTKYLMDYIASIPELVIEQKDIDKEREVQLKVKDHVEMIENESNDDITNECEIDDDSEDDDNEILSEINRSAKLVEIIGQMLRNRSGSLKKEQLKELTLSAYSSGLKFLNFFLTATQENQEYILNFIRNIFKENKKLSDEEITSEARNIFLMLCYGTSYSVIKKIANSLGSDKLIPIFDDINSHKTSPAMRLIHIAIQLEFTKSIQKKELSEAYSDFEGNPIAQRLLQELVVQHLYLNHVEYQDRQWISSKMSLPVKTQQLLQNKSEYKT